jgi:hypothetical protein
MAALTEIDRIRIHWDMEQLTELMQRKQWLWENTQDTAKRAQIMAELEQHQQDLDRAKAYLQ